VSYSSITTAACSLHLPPLIASWLAQHAIHPLGQVMPTPGLDQCLSALRLRDVSTALIPLADLPAMLPDDIVIGALSPRDNPAMSLLVHSAKAEPKRMFALPGHARVHVPDDVQEAQLNEYVPKLLFSQAQLSIPDVLTLLREDALDAALVPHCRLPAVPDDVQLTAFNPAEMVPAPGEGVWALCCAREDLDTRRLLKSMHRREVAAATNTERLILQQASSAVAAFVAIDLQNNYHVHAAMAKPLRRVRLSSTTNFQLADRVWHQLAGH
jgi:hydroxymethylbilane synthase